MSLKTGKRLHRRNWTTLPMEQDVLDRVDKLAKAEGKDKVVKSFNFEWRPGKVIKELATQEIEQEEPTLIKEVDEEQDGHKQCMNPTSKKMN